MTDFKLIKEAIQARKYSYSPFSHYKVGAAILTQEGKIFYGTNIENDSFGLTMCAERSAIFSAISNGYRNFSALAIITKDGGTSCGSCRQVILQFAPKDMPIYFCSINDNLEITSILTLSTKELLFMPFKLQ